MHQVLRHNLLHIIQLHKPIPNRLWINHHRRPMLALVQAARLIRPHATLQSRGLHRVLECVLQLATLMPATHTRIAIPFIHTNKYVVLKLRHRKMIRRLFLLHGHRKFMHTYVAIKQESAMVLKFFRFIALLCLGAVLTSAANTQTAIAANPATDAAGAKIYTYRQIDGREEKAYVFLPSTPGTHRAAVLIFHGGAWQMGDGTWMEYRAKEFAAKGMVGISLDYTLDKDGPGPSPIDSVDDACAAFIWVRAHAKEFGIDPNRVAGSGWSAGGHLVAAAALLPSVNGKPIPPNARPNALLLYSAALNMANDPFFMRLMKDKGDPAAYSPLQFVHRGLPPTNIIQGEEDSIVYAKDARAFCEAAQKVGTRCDLHIYPGVGHLLTRNIKVQYKDFDPDPKFGKEAEQLEIDFLASLGYINPQ
jgi:acetyl esterase